jgi:hypothetical protein
MERERRRGQKPREIERAAHLHVAVLAEAQGKDGKAQLLFFELLIPVGVEELEHLLYQRQLRRAASSGAQTPAACDVCSRVQADSRGLQQ